MDEMLGNIAHQWRQPLSVISTCATGLKFQKEHGILKDDEFNESCDVINSQTQYLSNTIDDFKNFIKNDRVKTIFKLENVMNSFLHLIESTRKLNYITVFTSFEEDITLKGSENELIQCLLNIFYNAKDAFEENVKDDRFIFITTSKKSNKVVITIKDNAKGIPENILSKIFEPYFTTKHKSRGTGLGLSMTYNLIVDGMNGNIEVDNVKYEYKNKTYKGALFTITLNC